MTSKPSGLFISFEGIDGAGKTTHIDRLAEAFARQGRVVCRTREPGGTPLAEQLRTLVLHEAMTPLTEALLIFAARNEHLTQVIEPALARGEVVLCDRFTDATFAYQGGGRGFDWDTLRVLERLVQARPHAPGGLREPDLTVWFDLSAEVAAARLADARVPDRFESQPAAFFQQVSQAYAQRAQAAPQRFARVQAGLSREAVWQQIAAIMAERAGLTGLQDTCAQESA